ncbi:class II fructose-bisphosphate aldolase [Candidatus Enterococcus ferrettii]|uniref:Tagatose 1,6-diphosphate aldolase GatY/KbaY n=1 Tax=Candidatus Enterococcus ferrettii TaxID=2815324 RepID=A0ABV0ERJ0_9ENTE|nr:class II fructose-bisphosphate aldolase [Enterococcus sp. 665A]MBO1338897.1 class II fructose-bisphosphate aldolase [Enterococcus sp. 665A]
MIINRDTIIKAYEESEIGEYAIPHFNHSDFWDMSFIVEAANEKDAPVIVACLPRVAERYGLDKLTLMMNFYSKHSEVPIIYHLDHCHDVDFCKRAIDAGFHSVMIDAASLSLEENIKTVKEVVDYARPRGVFVESEIGQIKSAGEEGYTPVSFKATVDEAMKLVEESDVDSLAVSIGSEHGFYAHAPELDFELLKRIKEKIPVPLVLHGGSGIPAKDVKTAIKHGIRKVNVGTEIRHTYITSLNASISENGAGVHTIDLFEEARIATKAVLGSWIEIDGAAGKGRKTYEK